MKKSLQNQALAAAAALLLAACTPQAGTTALENQNDTLSWALGRNTAQSLIDGNLFEVNHEVYLEAISATLQGKQQPITDSDYDDAIRYIMFIAQNKQMQQAAENRNTEQEFFAQLAQKGGAIKKHKAGFYYEELTPGKGPNAKYAQSVSFDYRSFLVSGQPFDQTYGKRKPITTVVGSPMFPALVEALQLMNKGSKYRFYFTSAQTRGVRALPPNTPLIYEIELHNISDF